MKIRRLSLRLKPLGAKKVTEEEIMDKMMELTHEMGGRLALPTEAL